MRLFLVLGIFIVLSSLTCIMPADANTVKATDELNNTPQTLKDKPVITEVSLGNKQAKNKIYVYIAPSCLHCGKFVVEDVEEFIRKNGQDCCVVIKLIPTSAKDIFIMKLIQKEAKDQDDYFKIFRNYIKRTLATINYITPTKEQIALFKGSKEDEEMIKFQVVASEFGFSNEKIVAAIPDMNGLMESEIIKDYRETVKYTANILNTKELELPLIIKDEKVYKDLGKAYKQYLP